MEDPLHNGRALQKTWKNSPKTDDPFSKGINLHPQTKFYGSQIPIQNPSPNTGIFLALVESSIFPGPQLFVQQCKGINFRISIF